MIFNTKTGSEKLTKNFDLYSIKYKSVTDGLTEIYSFSKLFRFDKA